MVDYTLDLSNWDSLLISKVLWFSMLATVIARRSGISELVIYFSSLSMTERLL